MSQRPKLQLIVRPPPRCVRCGEVISSGTYGIIFQDRQDPQAVIKGSIKATDPRADRCPELFQHEYAMSMVVQELVHLYMALYGAARHIPLETASPRDGFMEAGHCYYVMDKLVPLEKRRQPY